MASQPLPDELPIHFFTVVLNGEPFIRYHIEAFRQLPLKWHWHIVEGAAQRKSRKAWGGRKAIKDSHRGGRSTDGTGDYLDQLVKEFPDNITIYRKPSGQLWADCLEMLNAPLANLSSHCLLWRVDADELWSAAQIGTLRQLFLSHPRKSAAWFWCHFFLGPDRVISTRNGYSQNPQREWLRVWRFRSGMSWAIADCPRLVAKHVSGVDRDVGQIHPFLHYEMQSHGLVFQHFAHVLPKQLAPDQGAFDGKLTSSEWQKLQQAGSGPLLLKDYFPWVKDETTVNSPAALSITPIASFPNGTCQFLPQDQIKPEQPPTWEAAPRIVIDGVFFQIAQTGIARVWKSVLEVWARTQFADHIVILDRGKTAPIIDNLRYRDVPFFDLANIQEDSRMLQQICDLEQADLFISTYNTTPLRTPTVYLLHDMIPELLEHDTQVRPWMEKTFALLNASSLISVSQNSARDLHKIHPHIEMDQVRVAYPGFAPVFHPRSDKSVAALKQKLGLKKPYFLVVGSRESYKNVARFFEAYARLPAAVDHEIICVGGHRNIECELLAWVSCSKVRRFHLTDDELAAAYGGAIALVYPSLYEGFGLPVLEAMASGCPVITSPVSSLPEVGGDAVLYADPEKVESLVQALQQVQVPEIRQELIRKGLERAKTFSWESMAAQIEDELRKTAARIAEGTLPAPSPLIGEMRKLLFRSYEVVVEQKKRERAVKMKIWGKHRLKISLYR